MRPCPVCGGSGGFHANEPHKAVRDRIPGSLLRGKDWQREVVVVSVEL